MINQAEWINEERKETLNDREKFIHTSLCNFANK